jgi:hypothetical protein
MRFPPACLPQLSNAIFLLSGRHSLVLSFRANFLSTIVGLLLIPVGYPALYAIGPLWCVVAFGASCVVEIAYLRHAWKGVSWRWIVGGNAASSILLMAIPPVAMVIKERYPFLASSLEPYETSLIACALSISVVLFLASCVVPLWPVADAQRDEQAPERAGAHQLVELPGADVSAHN